MSPQAFQCGISEVIYRNILWQERCSVQQCHVQNFVTGKAHPEEVAAEAADVPLLQSVQAFLVDNGQVT
jgi:hypothetical protein